MGPSNRRLLNLLDPKTSADTTLIIENNPVSSSDIFIDRTLLQPLVPTFCTHNHQETAPNYLFSRLSPHSKACDDFCRTLAGKMPAIVTSVNYRLAPEHNYPCQYEHGFDALKFISTRNYAILPANTGANKCFLAGDSAGGSIIHHVALRASQNSHVFDKIALAGLVAVQPVSGRGERTESELRLTKAPVLNEDAVDKLWRMFLPAGTDKNHLVLNIFGAGTTRKL